MPVELPSDGYLDGGMKGCLYKMAKKAKAQWPIRLRCFDLEDLIQEGRMVYYKCRMRYVGRPPTRRPNGTLRRKLPAVNPDEIARRHFMRIVQRAFSNHLKSLISRQMRCVKDYALSDVIRADQVDMVESVIWDEMLPIEEEALSVSVLLQTAPNEIKQLFALLINDAMELARCNYVHRRQGYLRSGPRWCRRETNNERFCRLLGLPKGYDISGMVEKHFLGN